MTNCGDKMCVIKYSPTELSRVLPVDVGNVNLLCCAAVRQTKSRGLGRQRLWDILSIW